MKYRFEYLIIITILLMIIIGCVNKQPLDNPYDTDNPYYITPSVEIIQGPENGMLLPYDYVYFEWQGSKDEMLFKYYDIHNNSWSEWSEYKSVSFNYLDEGHYTFLLKGKYLSGDSTENPVTINFEVDAIYGPSIRLVRKYNGVQKNSTFFLDIIADEIDTTLAAEIIINYDTNLLECQQFVLGTFYGPVNNQIAFDSINVNIGRFILDVGCYGGNDQYASGTGLIGTLVFKAKQYGASEIVIDRTSKFRSPGNLNLGNILYCNSIIVIDY